MKRVFLAAGCLLGLFASAPLRAQDTFGGVSRIVALGDIHGDLRRLTEILRTAQLIDRNNAWTGGPAHLVLCGDMVDRGPASAQVLDFLMNLQPEAARAGGAVHPMLGNHEVMNVIGDLRYVSKQDWAFFRSPDSPKLRDAAARGALEDAKERARSKGQPPPNARAFLKDFNAKHPLGWVEHMLAFSPSGKYGAWLRQQKVIIKINDTIFMHAGLSAAYAGKSMAEINQGVLGELDNPALRADGMITSEDGPLWYRGLLAEPENDPAIIGIVARILTANAARRIVVGHSVLPVIAPRFGGAVVGLDVGLSGFYRGPAEFLIMEGAKLTVVCFGQRVDFPSDGRDIRLYLQLMQKADPTNSALRKLADPTRR